MSGSKIAIPAIPPVTGAAASGLIAALPIVVGVAAITMAAVMVADEARAKKLEAEAQVRRKQREERERALQERQDAIERNRDAVLSAVQEFASMRRAASELEDTGLGERRAEKKSIGATAKGFTDLGPQGPAAVEESRPVLEKMRGLLAGLPEDFKRDEGWPFQRFEGQVDRYFQDFDDGRPPALSQLMAFNETVARTLDRYQKAVGAGARAERDLLSEADRLLGEVLVCRHLALKDEHTAELEALRGRVTDQMGDRSLDWADLDVIRQRVATIRQEVDNQRQWRAYRRTLAESMSRHLEEMGYRTLEAFEEIEAQDWVSTTVAVPGGERLRVAMSADGRLNFDLAHERRDPDSPLTEEEIRFYRRQEDRWSRDFRELIRRLTKEGFSYQVQAEELARTESIPIVVVETADELAAEEEEFDGRREEPKRRRR